MKLYFIASIFASITSIAVGNSIFPAEQKSCESRINSSGLATKASTGSTFFSSLESALSIRGGEVLEPSTLTEVNDILMKASAEGKLVIM